MSTRMIRLATLLLAISVTGCASTADGPEYNAAKATAGKPGHATVYIFRAHAEPTLWPATVQVGDREIASLSQKTFTWIYMAPGKRTIKAVWAAMSSQKDSTISLDIKEDEVYFVELKGLSRLSGVSGGTMSFAVGSGMIAYGAGAGERRVSACCRFIKPQGQVY